uniref:Rho GTPase-activating protein 39 n=1 Tax=Timema genevievae TaxID=629358 RepID=A0A7R9JYQ6_TIMGE|nr:unnamed protein product [Timema genevievae]
MDWVEIIEPRTKEHMYANLTTGECVWDPPPGVTVKKTDNNQWWELFDQNTSRFYYYNATSQKTVWHRPQSCDIIPLAKLQTLKHNTEPVLDKKKESVSTQTPGRNVHSSKPSQPEHLTQHSSSSKTSSARQVMTHATSETQTSPAESPRSSRRSHHHHHHHHRHHGPVEEDGRHRGRRGSHGSGSWYSRAAHSQDSGRSSDSSSVSHSRTSLESGYRLLESPHHHQHGATSLTLSTSTPIFKKKPLGEANSQVHRSSLDKYSLSIPGNPQRTISLLLAKQRSFDVAESETGQDNRFPSSQPPSLGVPLARSYSFMQRQDRYHDYQDEEDSMHEKYFVGPSNSGLRSVECTPQSRRKYPNSPVTSNEHHVGASLLTHRKTKVESRGREVAQVTHKPTNHKCGSCRGNTDQVLPLPSTKTLVNNEERNCSSEEPSSSPSTSSTSPTALPHNRSNLFSSIGPPPNTSLLFDKLISGDTKTSLPLTAPPKDTTNFSYNDNSEVCKQTLDNNTPLYSNMDYPYNLDPQIHAHLLPLQQYILEQAKLSGCYKFGDPLNEEADSLHSEDEDHSRGQGEDDSDEFADDEGMSNQEDSSSQEYLDDSNYLEEEQHRDSFTQFHRIRSQYHTDCHNNDDSVDGLGYYAASVASGGSVNVHQSQKEAVLQTGCCVQTLPLETQHASLKRKKEAPLPPLLYSPILEHTEAPCMVLSVEKKLPSESDIEKYAQDNLNIHKKGIFRKKFSVRDMLSWSKDPIRKPMLVISDKALKKDACELFKLVQMYMSDRKAKLGSTLTTVALEICHLGYSKPPLRDELYIQICRQTTENPRRESLRRGWELLAICLAFFSPSPKFQPYLDSYMNRHRDPGFDFLEVGKWPIHVQISHYATVSCKRLDRIGHTGKKSSRKPSVEEIDQARLQIFRPSMFGNTLQEVMVLQKERFPHRKLPWIQCTLSEEVLRLQGAQTEGIFRVSADVDEVNTLKSRLDHWELPADTTDAHAPASLLKLWYRELYEPLIPDELYNDCVTHHAEPERTITIVNNLPELNKLVLCYLVRFLQIFARSEVVQVTKMDASNLAMVIAPNCLRCTSQDPRIIFENARKEMAFMRTLIQSLDTSFMEGIY